ncbi:SDR family NAD(P)-dependent oxidoreductase [Catelliglobosispora koreensis]|uniref:SDR family NAD(P)-dependent oxidoreductase n=1 Tax=Catelliglobosispora koreensis TaxID=129052 RepID=UPI0003683C28|nr:SDR family NAD(P)-dependent oxidoreductase [Catelliglobosispora koreensis]
MLALVTGATSGIGHAFAVELAARGWDLLLVARPSSRLDALRAAFPEAVVVPADLSDPSSLASVASLAASSPVDLLVNAAGLTLNTVFTRSPLSRELYLLSVNVTAVLALCHAVLPSMVSRGSGSIINVSSITGFASTLPGSTYPASKAWVTHFSTSLALWARPHGVSVMALCPGYTQTAFHASAGVDVGRVSPSVWLSPAYVARVALRDLSRDAVVCVPGWRYKLAAAFMRHSPRWLLHHVSRLVQPPHGT